jgi:DNA-binding transcriptional LysR family regulator
VLPTKRHGLRGVLDSAAQHEDVHFSPRFEIDVMSSIVKLVEDTHFATILPPIVVERAVRQGRLRTYPILAPRIVRHIIAISHPRRPLNAAAEALIRILTEELRKQSNVAPAPSGRTDPPVAHALPLKRTKKRTIQLRLCRTRTK